MKPNKRVNTNQTNNSNKKSAQIYQNSPSFQLPKIQKTSNYDTNSNLSYDFDLPDEKQGRYALDEIEQNQKEEGVVNYQKMSMEEIKHEFQRLRDQVSTLSFQVKKKQQLFQSKIMTKKQQSRISNPAQVERKLVQTEHQVYENSQLLFKLRQEYEQLERRSNLANSSISRPNADMNDKILTLRQKILTAKDKIKLLKRKTKKTGDDIVNGQNIHEVYEKLQRQNKALETRQAALEGKIDDSKYKIERQDEKLNQIQKAFSDAEDYMKLFKLQNEQIEEKNTLVQEWKQKTHRQEIIRRKIQSDQQTYLQKYHQLLKLFELQTQKDQKLDKKLIDWDIKILKARNSILDLEKEWDGLEEIIQTFSEQDQLKKEADALRRAMQGGNETFMTENGFAMTSNSLNSHMMGVKSIIEENESDIRDTIQGPQHNDRSMVPSSMSANVTVNKMRVRTKQKQNMLFTKIQDTHSSTQKKQNKINLTVKSINEQHLNFTDGKYYLSNKEIAKKREQQKNSTTLKKQSSTNDNRNGRKIYSLIKPNDMAKLKQLSVNRTPMKEEKILTLKDEKRQKQTIPHTAKQPYLSLNKNNPHETEIKKGIDSLRQRKNSLKVVTKLQNDSQQEKKDNLLEELQQINRQLLENTSNQLQKYDHHNDLPVQVSQQLLSRASLSGKIIKPQSKEERLIKPGSKEGKIRRQSGAIKSEIFEEIDKRNMEYSKKIIQLKRQIIDKENGQCQREEKREVKQTEQIKEIIAESSKKIEENPSLQSMQHQQQSVPQKRLDIQKVPQSFHQIKSPNLESAFDESVGSEDEDDEDDDIDQDISQINKMIKQKLEGEGIHAE